MQLLGGKPPDRHPGLHTRLSDRLAVVVEQRHAVLEQHAVDIALALADDVIELPLPQGIALAHAHGEGHTRA